MRDLTETLGQAIETSREALREMGRDPDAPIERPPPSVLSRSIHVAAMDLGRAARELGDEHWWIEGPLFAVVMRMAGKAARLCAFLAEGREPALEEVVAGNAFATLLLLEALDEQVVALQALGPAAGEILEARARFWRVLDPLRAQVPIASRAHLARLVERRRAPSPFVVRRPRAPSP